jgi:hypothetical protein
MKNKNAKENICEVQGPGVYVGCLKKKEKRIHRV